MKDNPLLSLCGTGHVEMPMQYAVVGVVTVDFFFGKKNTVQTSKSKKTGEFPLP